MLRGPKSQGSDTGQLILAVLEQAYAVRLRAEGVAWKAGVSPERAVYWRLSQLWRWGLIQRRAVLRGC
jgi:hypothetical protein